MLASVLRTAIGAVIAAVVIAQLSMQFVSRARSKSPEAQIAQPMRAPSASYAAPTPFRGEATIAADRLGQYATEVEVNGAPVHMLVDTGASSVVLSYDDAAAAGFYPGPGDFKFSAQTANGVSRMARVRLRQMRLGAIALDNVDAYVADRGALGASLLGMTFLSRLSHFEAASGRMLLRQ
ncbi:MULTISPECIES: retropepsin-like aspartic protease family protein [Methylosinus]|uniref:TIGR02281 family clan AA aspartic protease n=1 Tax=Methylosinus trichosporium (strain ATCC 35070 / NCIMB 11131 / UNIQEM 75 / OB3b) TaxID=595536 RepID=A0A2D2D3W9_METT3|nr:MULTISPECIES: TIGR02281 family clan AA aspartic protease [Methylosinus]ATQ69664.1 TIGR02281 family clan AA aspartic protease [Methylosinus trichosporium OB3b]OBS51248.1 transmembrane signal peptide protein [Methylosinus sp. 3S-1]